MPLFQEDCDINISNRQFHFSVNVDNPSDYFHILAANFFNGSEAIATIRFLNADVYTINNNIFIEIAGTPESEHIISRIFDNLPDYFANIEEEKED